MAIVGNGYQTGNADPGFYQNALKNLITNPNSFSGTPGYQFALNQGLDAVNRSNSAIRGSGNALIALQDRAQGIASQNYGSYLSQLGQLSGQENQYDLGLAGANNTAQGNANTLALGNAANANNATRNANDYSLGQAQNANTATRNANDYSLGQGQLGLGYFNGANNYALGSQQNANQAQNNWYNYSLGASRNQNDYNLGQGELGLGYYNADTNRGNARSNAFLGDQASQRAWYSVFPRQRVAGQP